MIKNTVLILFINLFSLHCFSQEKKEIIETVIAEITPEYPDVGIVIGFYDRGHTYYYSFGNRTKEGNQKLDSLSMFEIGSATKTFTALLLAHEIQRKNIGEHDFIDPYLPDEINLPCNLKTRIKVTDLASHQSGLPNLSNDDYFFDLMERDLTNPFRDVDKEYLYNVLSSTDSLERYREYQYNNYAFSLLGNLLENLNEKSYTQLVKEVILEPLKMASTSFDIPLGGNVAGLYNQKGVPQKYMDMDAVNPAGGLKSNAVDLLKYLKAHMENEAIADVVALTQRSHYVDQNKNIGLGWEIESGYFQKDGDTFGNSSLIRYSPKDQLAIVILSNHQNGQLVRDLMNGVHKRLRDQ